MNMSESHVDIKALMVGDLTDAQEVIARTHIAQCGSCRAHIDSLQAVEDMLRQIPPEALLEGPPPGSDLLLQRTLRQTRPPNRVIRNLPRRNSLLTISAAAAVLTLVAGVSAGIGYSMNDSSRSTPPPQAAPVITSSPAAEVPGIRSASTVNATTGTRLTASVEPAAGFVRVYAAVTGIPEGERCRLIVEGADGTRETAGSWVISEKGAREGATISGNAIIDMQNVSSVVIENAKGQVFASADF